MFIRGLKTHIFFRIHKRQFGDIEHASCHCEYIGVNNYSGCVLCRFICGSRNSLASREAPSSGNALSPKTGPRTKPDRVPNGKMLRDWLSKCRARLHPHLRSFHAVGRQNRYSCACKCGTQVARQPLKKQFLRTQIGGTMPRWLKFAFVILAFLLLAAIPLARQFEMGH
jgi:hypothetical protein